AVEYENIIKTVQSQHQLALDYNFEDFMNSSKLAPKLCSDLEHIASKLNEEATCTESKSYKEIEEKSRKVYEFNAEIKKLKSKMEKLTQMEIDIKDEMKRVEGDLLLISSHEERISSCKSLLGQLNEAIGGVVKESELEKLEMKKFHAEKMKHLEDILKQQVDCSIEYSQEILQKEI
ncbi:MAG: hypothetical protein MHPSP_003595, partial [Paramarteilia canceri]